MRISRLWPILFFVVAFFAVPMTQLQGLSLMPGDIGDSRLNNYFLENIYQFVAGKSDSLWHLPFFYPFPYVLGFSDNLFGSSPAYILARLFTGQADTAFQIWFLFGYLANFCAAYYALRRLRGSALASTIGALIFAFALPTTAHAGHVQLHYRFGIPLAIVFYSEFLNLKYWRYFIISGSWLVWQFYAGVYMGFFTLLLIATMTLSYGVMVWIERKTSLKNIFSPFWSSWQAQSNKQKLNYLGAGAFLLLLMCLLFYPYLQVSHLYGAKRSWSEIATMLPRSQSYLLSDASFLWSNPDSRIFANIPMRHEHQMFMGMVPLSLALVGFWVGISAKQGNSFYLMGGMLGFAIVLTISVGGFSFWYLLCKLPLASVIRAMTRLDQAILFPIAYFAGVAVDYLKANFSLGVKTVLVLILPLLIFEFSMTSMYTSSKATWRQRIKDVEKNTPSNVSRDGVFFYAQRSGPFYADELDAMWVSLAHGVKTMNGYSGIFPPGSGYELEYGTDCSVIPKRVLSYLSFNQQSGDSEAYRALMSRIVPIGFEDCDPAWALAPPSITSSDRIYTPEQFRLLRLESGEIQQADLRKRMQIIIENAGDFSFSAKSGVGKPIRFSWRFLDVNGIPLGGWAPRRDIPFDIPAAGTLSVQIPFNQPIPQEAVSVQVTLVQEMEFWAHDIGVPLITVPLK